MPQSHAFLSPAMYDAAGAVLMGQPATVPAKATADSPSPRPAPVEGTFRLLVVKHMPPG